jgi:hypothetical protein
MIEVQMIQRQMIIPFSSVQRPFSGFKSMRIGSALSCRFHLGIGKG